MSSDALEKMKMEKDVYDALEARVSKLEKQGNGWWDGFNAFLSNNPKIALAAMALIVWASTYFPTKYATPSAQQSPPTAPAATKPNSATIVEPK